ncbi:MAG: polymerase family protein [Microvirga sp.]|nr:polymerase family protein [Microvirga sp.]
MRRVVSLFLPTWPTDRYRKNASDAPPRDKPLVTATTEGPRRVIASADEAARALALRPGLTIAHAQAVVPELHIAEATPEDDAEGLARLATWCMRYSPLIAVDRPDGVWIEVAGSAHLFGGEEALLSDLTRRLRRAGVRARAAIADTPGTAWAVARHGAERIIVPGGMAAAIAELPVAALRLPAATVDALHRLGVERVGQVAAMPSAPLTRRFGADVRRRLDQALGHAPEPFDALMPPEVIRRRLSFAEPIGAREDLSRVVARLCVDLCGELAAKALGARRLDLVFGRVDRAAQAVQVKTARPNRDAAHLARLFGDRLDIIDPGFGIEHALLIASRVEPLTPKQTSARGLDRGEPETDLGNLVDRLATRLGEAQVYRQAPVESDLPERCVAKVPALAPAAGLTWPAALKRPTRLLDPPEPIEVEALVPDYPPAAFVWRRVRRRVVRADGPERVFGEWWRTDDERSVSRDYYRLEAADGSRYWVFRDGPAVEGVRWFLHGLFA